VASEKVFDEVVQVMMWRLLQSCSNNVFKDGVIGGEGFISASNPLIFNRIIN
jgi:hypothetical protein